METIAVQTADGMITVTTASKGDKGDAGAGIIAGGTSGQVLAKASDADFDTAWVDQTGGGGGGDNITSVFGRTGVVVAQTGDYTASQVGAATADDVADGDTATLGTAQTFATDAVATHVAASDPHGDRAVAASALATHIVAVDPHGDRAYADGVVATHVAASDPHGDRAYTDGRVTALINMAPSTLDTLGEIATQMATDESALSALTVVVGTKVTNTTTVNSHALSGNVTVTKSDVGLGNVDNTSDASKPVSTLQAAADATALASAKSYTDTASGLLVPKTTTLAGLDLSTNRTAAALKAALAIASTDVSGLGSAATTSSSAYATAAQGIEADNATPKTRLLAGLDLSADRTAAAIIAALGIEPWVKLFDGNLNSVNTQDVNVTGYQFLRWSFVGASTVAAATDTFRMRFNGDTGNMYSLGGGSMTSSMNVSNIPGATSRTWQIAAVDGAFTLGSATASTTGRSSSYGATTAAATLSPSAATSQVILYNPGTLAAITKLTFFLGSGANLFAQSRLIVEGIV